MVIARLEASEELLPRRTMALLEDSVLELVSLRSAPHIRRFGPAVRVVLIMNLVLEVVAVTAMENRR